MNTYISTCAMGRYTRLFLVFMACVVVICQAKSWSDESFHKNDDTGDNEEKASLTRLPDNGELFEGDMIMDNRLRRAVWGEKSKKSALLQVELKGYKWPHGIIYYEIDPDFPPENRAMLKKAMYEFRNRTCIRFHKRTNQHDYVYYSAKKDECSSSIGKIGGKQTIYLGVHCLVLGTFLHENMHALGFIHEHSRPDRDDYLSVKYENIEEDEANNFQKYKFNEVDNLHAVFDFNSILLYRNDAFTKNGKDTLQAIAKPSYTFGQRIRFSVGDVKEINRLYSCTKQLKNPVYDGLFKEVHFESKKRRDERMQKEKRHRLLLDYLRVLRERVSSRRRDVVY